MPKYSCITQSFFFYILTSSHVWEKQTRTATSLSSLNVILPHRGESCRVVASSGSLSDMEFHSTLAGWWINIELIGVERFSTYSHISNTAILLNAQSLEYSRSLASVLSLNLYLFCNNYTYFFSMSVSHLSSRKQRLKWDSEPDVILTLLGHIPTLLL